MAIGWQRRALVALIPVAIGLLVVISVTGVWLWQNYRPSAFTATDELTAAQIAVDRFRDVHNLASFALIAVVVAIAVLIVVIPAVRRWWPAVTAAIALVAVAFVTGPMLAWDQLSLWAVTTGLDKRGYSKTFSDEVRWVFTDGREVSPGTFRVYAYTHVTPAAVAIVAVVVLIAVLRGRHRDDDETPAETAPLEIPLI
jgi:quinol-cytochrome oxidoreductase complex cytochrome b subunit